MTDACCRSILGFAILCIQSPAVPAATNDPGPLGGDIPIVLTPTRLRQSLADVPASVTIITAKMLKQFGIVSIPEALRLVPGMEVTQATGNDTGNDYRIGYHGTNVIVPRRMNVLIDGMSVYRPAKARVDWKGLPVAIEDVDRIEITRGPNSASYGANSMLAIVNIITKHPREAEGTTLAATVGTQRTAGGTARYGGKFGEATAYRITLDHQQDAGFDSASTLGQGHDTTRINRLSFRSVTELDSTQSLDLQASAITGLKEVEYIDRYQQGFPDIDVRDYYFNGRWRKGLSPNHELQAQLYATRHRNEQTWRDCVPTVTLLPELADLWRANPRYVEAILAGRQPAGGTAQDNALAGAAFAAYRALGARAATPTCVEANQNYVESRYDFELQDTYVFSDALRMVSGIGLRRDVGDSQTYLQGRVSNNSWRLFSNVEYKPSKAISINAGGFLEKDHLTGSALSPRLALNGHVTDNQTIRFVVSRAVRMPDLLEQRADWRYRATNFSPPLNGATDGYFYASARAPGNVNAEKILSREIGYLGNFPQYGLLVDAKVFDDRLSSLLSEKLQVFSFYPTNSNWVHLRGSEVQVTYEPNNRWMVYLAYSYVDNNASTVLEQAQYSRHSGAIGLSHVFQNDWRATLAFYGAQGNAAGQAFYGREDLTLAKSFRFTKDQSLLASFTIRHLDNATSRYFADVGQTSENSYDRTMQYSLSLTLSF